MVAPELCKCLFHCSHDLGVVMLTGHHENCPDSPGIMQATRALLTELVHGIERWSAEEDGIPGELWDAYAKAKRLIGEPVPEN